MSLASKLLSASGGGVDKVYVDDVFSAYTYTGNGSTQTITNGVDLAGKGGMVWTKSRSNAYNNLVTNTVQGAGTTLYTDTTAAASTFTGSNMSYTGFNSNGYGLGQDAAHLCTNQTGQTYVSWTFRKAAKFFDVVTYTGNGVAGRQIPHALGIAPGMVVVKATSAGANWAVYHRSTGASQYLVLNLPQESRAGLWNSTAPTDSVITLGADALTNDVGVTYVAYLFAHDTSTEGLIQCGSFTETGSPVTVTLGWEPQYLLVKRTNSTGNWWVFDTARGWPVTGAANYLVPNSSQGEITVSNWMSPIATGFNANTYDGSGAIWAYVAIRRPNKPPTLGTQVYNSIARTGTGAAATVTGVGFAPDFSLIRDRSSTTPEPFGYTGNRLNGTMYMRTESTNIEAGWTNDFAGWDAMDGVRLGESLSKRTNGSGYPYINHFFKRAVGVFDVVCYTGTGVAKTEAHGLGVVPELMIVKSRSAASRWNLYHKAFYAVYGPPFNGIDFTTEAFTGRTMLGAEPTAAGFQIAAGNIDASGVTYVAYLFATKAGVSKVGSYTGNGTSQTLDMGFTTGARFFLVKATSTTGNWWIFDSVRGVVAAADPVLALNTTAAEITSADAVDPAAVGLSVNQEATCSINASGVSYIYLAMA